MITIHQKADRVKTLVGFDGKHVVPLPVLCMRKPVAPAKMREVRRPYFCFTSNFAFTTTTHIKPLFWLHCHRDPSAFSNAPAYLMSESDFVDPAFFPSNCSSSKQYDYVCYTCNDYPSGFNYKGFDVFLRVLPILNEMKLSGCLLVYVNTSGDWVMPISSQDRALLESSNLHIVRATLDNNNLAALMSSARFALFPNKQDCSPRMITEGFLNNLPVVMNKNIMGGWKYPEENPAFGATFDPDKLETVKAACQHALALPPVQKEQWMATYGFEKSSRKLANILKKHFHLQSKITHVYFSEFSEVFKVLR